MPITPWNPSFSRLLNRWPDIWDDDSFSLVTASTNTLDVYETDNEVVVKANVAGIPEKEIDLTFEKGILWIKANKQEERTDDKRKHYSQASWSYSYKVAVPGMLDYTVEPTAVVKDGVITITFRKAEASKPKKLTVKRAE